MNTTVDGLQSFLAMGGYGGYVWGSFGFAAVAIASELIGLRARRRALRRQVEPAPEEADLHTPPQPTGGREAAA